MRHRTLARTLLVTLSLAMSSAAIAAGDHDHDHENNPEAKYRYNVMEAMSSNFTAMAAIFTRKVDRPDELAVHARALAENASLVAGLFPEGSEGGAALPLIWEEPDKVAEISVQAADAARALAVAAEGGNQSEIARAFKAAGDGCKTCHERYKAEDD